MHHSARIEANQPLYTLHSLLIFDIFTHNLRASCIVYSHLHKMLVQGFISESYSEVLIGKYDFLKIQSN